jgi:hypothetical protein
MDHETMIGSWSMVDSRSWGSAATSGLGGRRDSSEKGGGGRRGVCWDSHQWCQLEAKLWRWPHDSTQERRLVVLRWRDGSGHEEDESWWVR